MFHFSFHILIAFTILVMSRHCNVNKLLGAFLSREFHPLLPCQPPAAHFSPLPLSPNRIQVMAHKQMLKMQCVISWRAGGDTHAR